MRRAGGIIVAMSFVALVAGSAGPVAGPIGERADDHPTVERHADFRIAPALAAIRAAPKASGASHPASPRSAALVAAVVMPAVSRARRRVHADRTLPADTSPLDRNPSRAPPRALRNLPATRASKRRGMTTRIYERLLPGVGRRYDLRTDEGRRLTIVKLDTGGCELSLHSGGRDDSDASVALDHGQALTLAAILTGADFSIEPVGNETEPDAPDTP